MRHSQRFTDVLDFGNGTLHFANALQTCTGFEIGVLALAAAGTGATIHSAVNKPNVPKVPSVPDTLNPSNIESSQADAERTELRKRAGALQRSQVNFTSSLGSPISSLPKSFKTALGGFSNG